MKIFVNEEFTVLCYVITYIILYHTLLYYTLLYYTILYYTILHDIQYGSLLSDAMQISIHPHFPLPLPNTLALPPPSAQVIEQLHILTNEVLRVYPSGSAAAAFLNVSQVRTHCTSSQGS